MNIFDEYSIAGGAVDIDNQSAPSEPEASIGDFEGTSKGTVGVDETPRELFNGREAAYTLKAERPEHRAIIMMKASAMNNKEIAAATGRSAVYVSYVVKQPWAQEQILREIESAGREPVVALLQGAVYEATERLIELSISAEKEETRLKANQDIINRTMGMPNQSLTINQKVDATKMSEKDIDQRLAELYAKRAS